MKARPRVVPAPAKSPRNVGKPPIAPGSSMKSDGRDLALPHERDESAGSANPEPQPVMQQAYADIQAGQVDTDLRATPGLDARRRRALLRR
ncbi:hypothetical protein [Ideonella sp.]|uniref:hypothetical protein n=1 Tax=Ideonella sp. TaxID=1929293 RepID=UPI0035B4DB24